ncbi:kinesin-like protein KIF23 [Aphidius gifuensis]|uniref:kinesin-like protein KIF23 n=1 Tax=Aphidius gifuensis TaxID=684658 RepID=UPI001CDC5BFF|nr:kinesin-like protein KIF23 [Aphidius gifuensis]
MKTSRPKAPMSARKPAKPRFPNVSSKDPVQVYCRIRPMQNPTDESCMKIISPTTLVITPPESAINFRSNSKDIQTSFTKIFDDNISQKELFNEVALPFVENLIAGKNSLLFTYGVTGSGKTYTMTGDANDVGIMPRCLDVLFNSITNYQAKKYVFKPDKLNGFEVQSDADALIDRQTELNAGLTTPRNPKKAKRMIGHDSDTDSNPPSSRERDESLIIQVDQDNSYAVFVTYVEIYNNSVFDLLDDNIPEDPRCGGVPKNLQSKLIREDGNKNMFVHAVTEVEVNSPEDAFQVYNRGQRRRRVAHTALNTESSRSHSTFTIRLVQAPLDCDGENVIQDKRVINISQLSLVDLAGSERTNRTKNTGQRLREAGQINNSLMTLRTCLEILRENQVQGINKIVPYRESKLTHLFKNYFDGEGSVRMIVCVNPRCDDYDETIQVMKFAEITQEVQVTRPTVQKIDMGFTPGRRQANKLFKEAKNKIDKDDTTDLLHTNDIGFVYSLGGQFPELELTNPHNDRIIKNLINFLQQRINKKNILRSDLTAKQNECRKILHNMEKDNIELRIDNSSLKNCNEQQKEKINTFYTHVHGTETQNDHLFNKLKKADDIIKSLRQEIHHKEFLLNQQLLNEAKLKKDYDVKLQNESDKIKRDAQRELKYKNQKIITHNKQLEEKVKRAQEIFTSNLPISTVESNNVNVHEQINKWNKQQPSTGNDNRTRKVPVVNLRSRRSRSTEGRWVSHQAKNLVPLDTVLQPRVARKSLSKMLDPKEVTGSSRYCLIDQEQDTDGELETKVYKGDILRTSGGGAQVVFNDVEHLKQMSPTAGKKRSSNARDNNENQNIPADNKRPRVNR